MQRLRRAGLHASGAAHALIEKTAFVPYARRAKHSALVTASERHERCQGQRSGAVQQEGAALEVQRRDVAPQTAQLPGEGDLTPLAARATVEAANALVLERQVRVRGDGSHTARRPARATFLAAARVAAVHAPAQGGETRQQAVERAEGTEVATKEARRHCHERHDDDE